MDRSQKRQRSYPYFLKHKKTVILAHSIPETDIIIRSNERQCKGEASFSYVGSVGHHLLMHFKQLNESLKELKYNIIYTENDLSLVVE